MDFNVISRLESHAGDLFKLDGSKQQQRQQRQPQRQGQQGNRTAPAAGLNDARQLPPSRESSVVGFGAEQGASDSYTGSSAEEDSPRSGLYGGNESALAREEALVRRRAKERRTARREAKEHYEDLWGAITRNIGKGFVMGYVAKVGINSLFPILDLARGRKVQLTQKAILGDAREYGLFCGSILGFYNAIMYQTRRHAKDATAFKHYRGFLAGLGAGLSLVWVPRRKRWPIVLFALVRALELQAKLLARRGVLPNMANADVALMCAASASMLHSWLFRPDTLDASYRKFLTKQSQVPTIVRTSLSRMYRGLPLELEALNEARAKMGARALTSATNYDSLPPGELLHPNQSLLSYAIGFYIRAMRQAVPVYLPVFALPVLLFYPRALVRAPLDTIKRVMLGVLRSSTFLSCYVTFGFNSMSLLRRAGLTYAKTGVFGQSLFMIAGVIGGLATRIEKKSRRIELALFVLSKAIEGRWNELVKYGGFRPIRDGDVLVFMYCCGIIAHTFTRHPSLMRVTYSGLLSRFFDTDKRHRFYALPRIVSEQFVSVPSAGRPPSDRRAEDTVAA